jgi:hypothetical protein
MEGREIPLPAEYSEAGLQASTVPEGQEAKPNAVIMFSERDFEALQNMLGELREVAENPNVTAIQGIVLDQGEKLIQVGDRQVLISTDRSNFGKVFSET